MAMVRAGVVGTLAACLAGTLLVGCSEQSSSPAPTPTTSAAAGSPSASVRSGPLRLSVYGGPSVVRGYRAVASAFTAETGVRVEIVTRDDAGQAGRKVRRALLGGRTAPDVFLLGSTWLPDLVPTDRLQHVDGALEERGLQFGDGYQRVALTAFGAEDVLQCMPVDMAPRVMIVNRDFVRPRDLEIRGVPLPEDQVWDFEDFAAAARLIAREQQGVPGFKAVHLPTDVELLTAFIRSAGGEVVDDVDEPTALALDSDEAREVLEAYVGLARERSVALTTEEVAQSSARDRFANGQVAMMFGTRADVPALRSSGVPFDVMPLPTFGASRTVADIAGLCVDAQSAQLEDALDFVAFVAGNQGSTLLARTGGVQPANLDVTFSPVFAQRGERPRSVDVFTHALKRVELMPFSTQWRPVAARVEAFVSRLVISDRRLEQQLDRRLPRLDEQSLRLFETPESVSSG